jgi:ribosomal protein S4
LYEGPRMKKLKKRKIYNLFLNKKQRQIKKKYYVKQKEVKQRQKDFETRSILRHQRRRYRHKHCFNYKNKFMIKTYIKKILFLKNLNYLKYLKKSFCVKAKTFKMRKLYGLYHFRLDLFCLALKLSLSLKHIRIAIVNGFIWVN